MKQVHDRAPVSRRIVEAVAAAEGVRPEALSRPLWEAVEADALDRLCTRGDRVRVRFDAWGYAVEVDETGAVTVDEPSEERRLLRAIDAFYE